jgi:hypothetical protein
MQQWIRHAIAMEIAWTLTPAEGSRQTAAVTSSGGDLVGLRAAEFVDVTAAAVMNAWSYARITGGRRCP